MQAVSAQNGIMRRAKAAAREFCPKPLLLWREARYFEKYGERELRLVRHLCQRERDAVDVGAHEGSYVHFMKRYARRVYAFEPVPSLAEALAWKFAPRVVVRNIALSRESGMAILRIPLIDGAALNGLASLNNGAGATAPVTEIAVQTRPLDEVFAGDAGFIKVDVEGHEEAVLDGAARTIARCRPRLLIEIEEGRMPGAPARIHAFLRRFNYRGYFVCGRTLAGFETFDPTTMQRPADIAGFRPGIPRQSFDRYCNNFLFIADEEAEPLSTRIAAALQRI